MNFYKRYPGDYMRDTAHLSMVEHGAYTLLMDWCYSAEKPIPNIPAANRICRAFEDAEKAAVRSVISGFFIKTEIGYENNRINEQIKKDYNRVASAKANGSKGGRPKKETQEIPTGFCEETQQEPKAKAIPEARSQKPETRDYKPETRDQRSKAEAQQARITLV